MKEEFADMGWFTDFFETIVRAFIGKKIAVLGERGVGKTVLLKFLSTGEFTAEYEQSVGVTSVAARSFKLNELKLHLKKGSDVPGEADFYDSFKKLYAEANFCFYLMHAQKVIEGDKETRDRCIQDAYNFSAWKKERGKSAGPVFVLITHADHLPEFKEVTKQNRGRFEDKLRKSTIVKDFCRLARIPTSRVVVGSLKSQKTMEDTVYRLFKVVLDL